MDLNEYLTRREKIDVMLRAVGWDVPGEENSQIHKYVTDNKAVAMVAEKQGHYGKNVILEVDTRQSNFKKKDYKTVSETLRLNLESKYADYLLLDRNQEPLAVVEAKRTSKDPIIGHKQAEEYAEDIKAQTGKDVFILFTNGYEVWFWNKPFKNPRLIKGFYSPDDLDRIRFQNHATKKFKDIPIKKEIIDRPYQIEAVKRILEGIDKGRRKFLIVQATGTGKTRVSMALIDVLLRANRVQKVLFLADRRILRDDAYNYGFKVFFPNEAKTKIFAGAVDKNCRLYCSTIQTIMECYQEFSPGYFDLIISDEAHRSIYNKWKDVFTYFDAIQVGLTATPSDLIERDTFRFFECEDSTPTALYTYDQAVKEGYLADYEVYGAQTNFQIKGIKPRDIPNEIRKKLVEEGLEEDEMNWEGTEIEKAVSVVGTNEVIIKEFMDNCLTDQNGTLPAKTIFFAVSKKHAKRLWEAFEKLYPEYKGRLTRVIISEDPRALQIKDDFKKLNFPRIAISVDMLDTGVDIQEVCNLVFAKPVFSNIKFHQMIGRGTRHDVTCTHKDWLPNGKKEFFRIFDFWKNFEFFDLKPEGKEVSQTEAVTVKIFKTRLQQLEIFLKRKDNEKIELLQNKLTFDIKSLPMKSVSIKENMRDVETALSKSFWTNVGLDPLIFLQGKIMRLMKFQPNVNINVASFTYKTEMLGLALLTKNSEEIGRLKREIGEFLNCLPRNLTQVKAKIDLLDKVLTPLFWDNIKYEDTLMLLNEFAPLMIYKRKEPRPQIILDIDDVVKQRKIIEFGPEAHQEYVKTYQEKVERRIKELAKTDRTIKKIENDAILSEDDLKELENKLNSPELFVTEDVLQKVYEQTKGTMVQFIKKVLGLYEFPNPEKLIEEEFKTFIVAQNQVFTADQINFLRTLQTVIMKKKHIDYVDFFEPPFINIPNAPKPLFSDDTLKDLVGLCKKIEVEVFA